ncbi:hypothetical protein EVAR_66370_1 [Eumeta japonica]|uniref:Uncharacterized protein n=1 Tax=Eumeta variegata TaxID=151549 RepID=A0A4C1ZGE1_EUMVA|nr:hypothetical protein EVAR_66370_1 [Eumeta japonica]
MSAGSAEVLNGLFEEELFMRPHAFPYEFQVSMWGMIVINRSGFSEGYKVQFIPSVAVFPWNIQNYPTDLTCFDEGRETWAASNQIRQVDSEKSAVTDERRDEDESDTVEHNRWANEQMSYQKVIRKMVTAAYGHSQAQSSHLRVASHMGGNRIFNRVGSG